MLIEETNEYVSESEHENESEHDNEIEPEEDLGALNDFDTKECLVVHRALNAYPKLDDHEQHRENIFHIHCMINGKVYTMIIDSSYCANVASIELVRKLNLPMTNHPHPYKLAWLNDCGEVRK